MRRSLYWDGALVYMWFVEGFDILSLRNVALGKSPEITFTHDISPL